MRNLQRWLLPAALPAVLGLADVASAQTRSWMQTSRAPTSAVVSRLPAEPTAPTFGPSAQGAVPRTAAVPAISPSLPMAPRATPANVGASAGLASQTAITTPPGPAGISTVYYPLPGTAAPTGPNVMPTAAVMSAPVNFGVSSSGASPAYLSAQQPTLAPPIDGAPLPVPAATFVPPGGANIMTPAMSGSTMVEPNGGGPSMWNAPTAGPMNAPMWSRPGGGYGPIPDAPYAAYSSNAPIFEGAMDYGGDGACCDPGIPMMAGRGCGPWFLAVSGIMLTRDVPNNVELSFYNAVPQTTILNSETAGKDDWTGGIETRFGRMLGERWAIEAVYWTVQSQHDYFSIRDLNNGISSRLDFVNLTYQGQTLDNIYNNSREHRLFRGNTFENIEINLMQQAVMVDPGERFGMTMFSGARYFRFDEHLQYDAVQANSEFADGDLSTQSNYYVTEKNRLVGWQIGARSYLRVGNRLRLFAMPRFGLFANRISQQQHVCMLIDEHAEKTDVALLGQLDLGLSYQVLPCVSLYGSYRAMGVSGVATSDDNFARTFTSPASLASINSSGSLILHGWQAGLQWQF